MKWYLFVNQSGLLGCARSRRHPLPLALPPGQQRHYRVDPIVLRNTIHPHIKSCPPDRVLNHMAAHMRREAMWQLDISNPLCQTTDSEAVRLVVRCQVSLWRSGSAFLSLKQRDTCGHSLPAANLVDVGEPPSPLNPVIDSILNLLLLLTGGRDEGENQSSLPHSYVPRRLMKCGVEKENRIYRARILLQAVGSGLSHCEITGGQAPRRAATPAGNGQCSTTLPSSQIPSLRSRLLVDELPSSSLVPLIGLLVLSSFHE